MIKDYKKLMSLKKKIDLLQFAILIISLLMAALGFPALILLYDGEFMIQLLVGVLLLIGIDLVIVRFNIELKSVIDSMRKKIPKETWMEEL